jgi:hypothetical protein
MSEFFVALDEEYVGCWNCNSNKKTYVIYDYYDSPLGYWCKDCWYSKMTGIQMKFLGVIMKYDNGFFRQQNTKIGNITQSYDRYTLPPNIDTEGF